LKECGLGLGKIALGSLLTNAFISNANAATGSATNALRPHGPHFPGKARRVIHLFMAGAPSQLDLFDYKPELTRLAGKPLPPSVIGGQRYAFIRPDAAVLGPQFKFARHGQSGAELSEMLPHIAEIVDDICLIKSMKTDQFNHAPAELLLFTGSPQFGRPSMGSWVTYGLGSESQNLPGFIALVSSGTFPSAGNSCWSNGFLPSVYQGVQCRSQGEPVLYVTNPAGMDQGIRRLSLDAIRDLNEMQAAELGSPETRTRIAQYELAFRMQTAVPEVMDITREPQRIIDAYGAQPGTASLANNCLLARRLIERGVRFVQLHDWGWDFHGTGAGEEIRDGLVNKCRTMDKAVTALIRDLKFRGLLDETLVIWGGEFGRSPFREGRTANSPLLGRDHHPFSFTMFMAGGGTRAGVTYGASDDLGFDVGTDPVTPHDFQATVLHLLGLDHLRLTHRYQGRDFRLTDVYGNVVQGIVA
jgi:hypothetical protein